VRELQPRDARVLQGAGAVVGRRGVAAAVEPDPVGLHRGRRVPVPPSPPGDAAVGPGGHVRRAGVLPVARPRPDPAVRVVRGGALWSYGVLGWGGYWAWDPVENVALLPWLVATALLHSVMLQERRGMLKVWNLALAVGGFALTTFGTFLTRGSILSLVHTFAQSAVGPMYLGFLVLVLVSGFGLIAMRAWRLRTEGRF